VTPQTAVRFRRLLLSYLLRYRWRYLPGFFALLGASLVVMVPPLVLRHAIDAIAEGSTGSRLAAYGAMILGLAIVESLMRFAARHLVSGTSRRVEYDLRNDLAAHLMRLDQRFYVASQTGDLMARATNDLQVVRDLVGPTLLDLGRTAAMMLFGVAFLLSINVRLALVSIAYLPLIAFLVIYFQSTIEGKYRAVQDQFGKLTTHAQENISGIRTIKAYAQEETEIASFARANQEMMRRSMSWAYYTAGFWPLMTVAAGASTAVVLWFGGHDVVAGRITIGQFVQFNAYLFLLAQPMLSLGWTFTTLQQGIASMKRITEVLSTEPLIKDPAAPAPLTVVRGDIEFQDVTFRHGDIPVLSRINLKIPAGSTVALVGGTGAGKTSLVSLLVRLYDPTEGRVLLDGIDVRDLPLEQVRAAVGFVPQETFLFSEPLKENISYARANPSQEEMTYAIETSQLVTDLPQLTHGLDTVIGERGVTLSGGQKQRAALARALIKNAPVVVLDDALSHVDTHTEEEILRRLGTFMADRTTILIAHRTSTLAGADFIVALEDGTIAEVGTHEELLQKEGVYARFFRRQLLAEQIQDDAEVTTASNGGSRS